MRIDFPAIEAQAVPNFKGGLGYLDAKMHFDGQNRILHAFLPEGSTVGLHQHVTSSEIIYVLAGSAVAQVDGVDEPLGPGVCSYCPKGSSHQITCVGADGLEFFAVVPEQ